MMGHGRIVGLRAHAADHAGGLWQDPQGPSGDCRRRVGDPAWRDHPSGLPRPYGGLAASRSTDQHRQADVRLNTGKGIRLRIKQGLDGRIDYFTGSKMILTQDEMKLLKQLKAA